MFILAGLLQKFQGRKAAIIKLLEMKIIIKEEHLSLLGTDLLTGVSERRTSGPKAGRSIHLCPSL